MEGTKVPKDDRTDAERRLDVLGRELFDRAVTRAATIATQRVARIHRVRLVTQAAGAAFVVAILIGIGLAFVFRQEAIQAARTDAQRNCHLVQQLAYPIGDFLGIDAHLLGQQAQLEVAGIIQTLPPALAATMTRLTAAAKLLSQSAFNHWTTVDIPQIKAAAALCAKRAG